MPLEPSERDAAYLWHIADACRQVVAHTERVTRERFLDDRTVREAIYWNIHVIGEAVRKLSDECKSTLPDVPWRDIRAMRNRITHGYDTIDDPTVWDAVQTHIPALLREVEPLVPPPPPDPTPED